MFILILILPSPAPAQPLEKQLELRRTETRLERTRARSEALQRELDALGGELGRLSLEVTAIASSLRENERDVAGIEEKLAILEGERKKKRDGLTQRRTQMARTVSAMLRLASVPAQAAAFMPATFTERATAARVMAMTSRALEEDMSSLRMQLASLRELEEDIAGKREELARRSDALEKRRAALDTIIARRKELMERLGSENAVQKRQIASLVQRSRDLQSLVASLEKARERRGPASFPAIGLPLAKPSPPGSVTQKAPAERDFGRARGKLLLPVTGRVTAGYGRRRGVNDTLKGLEIAARPGAKVVAPWGGEVLFTGPFMDYGNMVIVRHSRRYHTLVAGLARIDCVPGQILLEGEPIGAMDAASSRTLYMELRMDGRPVDPVPWLGKDAAFARN